MLHFERSELSEGQKLMSDWVIVLVSVGVGWVLSQVTEAYRVRAARELSAEEREAARKKELMDFQRDTLLEFGPLVHEWISWETKGQMMWANNLRQTNEVGNLGEVLDQLQFKSSVQAMHFAVRVTDLETRNGFKELRARVDALDQRVLLKSWGKGELTSDECLHLAQLVSDQHQLVAARIDVVLQDYLSLKK